MVSDAWFNGHVSVFITHGRHHSLGLHATRLQTLTRCTTRGKLILGEEEAEKKNEEWKARKKRTKSKKNWPKQSQAGLMYTAIPGLRTHRREREAGQCRSSPSGRGG